MEWKCQTCKVANFGGDEVRYMGSRVVVQRDGVVTCEVHKDSKSPDRHCFFCGARVRCLQLDSKNRATAVCDACMESRKSQFQ